MMSRWTIALTAGAVAAVATMSVIALSDRGAEPATATVPDDTLPGRSSAGGDRPERSVTVNGHGTVEVTPDVAHVSMGVQANADNADEVFATIETKSTALNDTLQGLGIAEADIRTSSIGMFPTFDERNEITGYQGSVSVDVTVRDVARVGEILDGVRGLVGPELTLGGIAFSYADPEAVLGDARAAAIENARVRAGQYADAAGSSVGAVVHIMESSVATPLLSRTYEAGDAAAPEAAIAVEPGSQELEVDVTVVFELRQ